jgi:hypothetical protein
MSWRDHFKIHPAAEVFPLLPPDELKKLAADIDKNGLKVSIQTRTVVNEATPYLVDGRNRLDAMELLGWQIVNDKGEWIGALATVPGGKSSVEHFNGRTHEQIISEVRAFNIERRHLTKQQLVEMIDATVRSTSPSMARSFNPVPGKKGGSTTDQHKAEVTKQAARQGISKRTTERALARGKKATKPAKRKATPRPDLSDPKVIIKKFQRFMDAFPVTIHRTVRGVIREFLK